MPVNEFGDTIVENEPSTNEFGDRVVPGGVNEFGDRVTESRPEKKARLKREIAAIPDTGTGWLSGETLRQFPEAFSELGKSPLTRTDEESNAAIDRLIERGADFVAPVTGRFNLETREKLGQFAKGGAHLAKGLIDFSTSPKGMAALAAQFTPLAPVVNATMAKEAMEAMPETSSRAGTVSVTGTPDEKATAYADAIASPFMVGGMLHGIGAEMPAPRARPEDFASSAIRREDAPGYVPPAEPLVPMQTAVPARFDKRLPSSGLNVVQPAIERAVPNLPTVPATGEMVEQLAAQEAAPVVEAPPSPVPRASVPEPATVDPVEKLFQSGDLPSWYRVFPKDKLAEYARTGNEDLLKFKEDKPDKGIIAGTQLEDWADKIIKDASQNLGANQFLDPRLLAAASIKGAALIERGITYGADWIDHMVKEFGPEVGPYLQEIRQKSEQVRAERFAKARLPKPKEQNAIQESGTKQVGVRQQGAVRQEVGQANGLPQPRAAGEAEAGASETPLHEEITQAVTGPSPNSGPLAGLKNFIANWAGKTLPKTHRADRETGEAGARYGASRVGAQYAAEAFAKDVLRGVDGTKFQAALTEDNLRSIRDNFEAKGETDAAEHVRDIFNMAGSPFKNEEEYQAFLKEPETQAALERYKARREHDIEPLYKQARDIDPNVDLPGRGKQTGARTNLYVPDEETGGVPQIRSTPNLRATYKRRTRFANPASGAAEQYGFDFNKAMENTYSGLYEIANKNAFDKKLVESGNAVIGPSGLKPVLEDGETTENFPLRARTPLNPGKNAEDIYVRKSLADEYAGVSNTRKPPPTVVASLLKGTEAAGNLFNKAAVAGLTDASVHVKNLGVTIMTRPGVIGGNLALDTAASLVQPAYAIASLTKALAKGMKDNTEQLAELAAIGALREQHPGSWNISKGIEKIDRLVRLSLDDTYQTLAKQGVVEDTEQARREFVNQAGNYNKRLQGYYTSVLKQTGVSPFIVAGKTMNANAARFATLNPGVPATTPLNAALLRANVAAKWAGAAGMVIGANYLLTGKVGGRPGTPLGKIDTGMDDKAGRPILIPAFDIMGEGRAMRVSGTRGYIEAKRLGLPEANAEDAAVRDIANSQIGVVAGPMAKFAYGATMGQPLGVKIGQGDYEPPFFGERGWLKNLKQAATEVNPTVNAIHTWMQPGSTWKDFLARQFPGITPQPGKPSNLTDNYKEKVSWAEDNTAMEFVMHKARGMDQDAKITYLQQKLLQLPESERAHAWQEIKRRKVLMQGR